MQTDHVSQTSGPFWRAWAWWSGGSPLSFRDNTWRTEHRQDSGIHELFKSQLVFQWYHLHLSMQYYFHKSNILIVLSFLSVFRKTSQIFPSWKTLWNYLGELRLFKATYCVSDGSFNDYWSLIILAEKISLLSPNLSTQYSCIILTFYLLAGPNDYYGLSKSTGLCSETPVFPIIKTKSRPMGSQLNSYICEVTAS